MSKQDRQGVRTPSDIERKYNIGKLVKDVEDLKKKVESLETQLQKQNS